MRTWIGIGLVALAVTACDEDQDDNRLEGTYGITVFEIEDTCDNEQNQVEAVMTIQRRGDDAWDVVFGDAGTLTGTIDAQGILQTSGTVSVNVDVNGTPQVVTADMQMQIGQLRTGEIEASGRLIFDGTFPGVPEECEQTFVAEGNRQNRAPVLLMTGPDGR